MPITSDNSIREIRQTWVPGAVRSEAEYSRLERLLTKNGREPLLSISEMMEGETCCPYCDGWLREVELESGAGLNTVLVCAAHGIISGESC